MVDLKSRLQRIQAQLGLEADRISPESRSFLWHPLPDPDHRLFALLLMREQIARRLPLKSLFALARSLIADEDNDCRWQALIVVGGSIESDPESVWPVVVEFGESDDEDMRAGVASVLLEHLLEYHFDRIFPRLTERIESGSIRLGDTLSRCWSFGQAEAHRDEIQTLLRPASG